MLKDYFAFAWRSLTHKKLRSWLTLLGILIGVMAVVSLISLGDGLKVAVNSQFGVSATEVITIQAGGFNFGGPPGTGVATPLTTEDTEAIEKLSRIDIAIERVIESGQLEFNDIAIYGFAMNVPDGEERDFSYDALDLETFRGRLLRDGDSGKVVLGYNFYDNKVGLEKSIVPGKKIILNDKEFEVVGIVDKLGSLIFDNIVMLNDDDLRSIMSDEDQERVDVIVAKVKDMRYMDSAKEDIEKLLRDRRDVKKGEEDFSISTPETALDTVNSILTGIQIFIVIIASISILVGALGIVNTMTTSVLERKKQIGIMKAIGAKNIDIFMQFFIESGLMGLIGGLIGVIFGAAIGYVGTLGINSFIGSNAEPVINFWLIFFTLLGSFIIGAISGIVPAMKAAKQSPVDALRG